VEENGSVRIFENFRGILTVGLDEYFLAQENYRL